MYSFCARGLFENETKCCDVTFFERSAGMFVSYDFLWKIQNCMSVDIFDVKHHNYPRIIKYNIFLHHDFPFDMKLNNSIQHFRTGFN